MSLTSSEANKQTNKQSGERIKPTRARLVVLRRAVRVFAPRSEHCWFGQVIANDELRSTHDILRITHEQALKQVGGSAAYGWHWPVQQSLRDR